MDKYNGSPIQMLKSLYPKYIHCDCHKYFVIVIVCLLLLFSYAWKPWLFARVESGHWNSQQNIKEV